MESNYEKKWDCDIVGGKFQQHPMSKKIYKLLHERVGNNLVMSDCIVFFY